MTLTAPGWALPPTPSGARAFLRRAPQLMIYPSRAISLVVVGFNLLGDGLRVARDPRLKS